MNHGVRSRSQLYGNYKHQQCKEFYVGSKAKSKTNVSTVYTNLAVEKVYAKLHVLCFQKVTEFTENVNEEASLILGN